MAFLEVLGPAKVTQRVPTGTFRKSGVRGCQLPMASRPGTGSDPRRRDPPQSRSSPWVWRTGSGDGPAAAKASWASRVTHSGVGLGLSLPTCKGSCWSFSCRKESHPEATWCKSSLQGPGMTEKQGAQRGSVPEPRTPDP